MVLGQSYYHIDAYRSPGGVDSALQHWAAAPTGARWRDPEEQSASPGSRNQARNEIKEHTSSAVGTLRVSAPVAFDRRHIAPLLSTLLKKNPGLKLDFSLNDRFVDPVGEKLDLCIRLGILPDSSLICSKLAGLLRVLCASPEYLLKHGLPRTPEELERHICLQHNGCSNASLSWQFSSADSTRRIRISPVSRLSVNSAELLVEGALQGLGIIHAPTWLVHEEVVSGRLVTFLERHALPEQAQGGIYGDRRVRWYRRRSRCFSAS